MQGCKNKEYRSIPTNIRERIFIYAFNTLEKSDDYNSKSGVEMKDLPRGLLVGTVESAGCEGSKERVCMDSGEPNTFNRTFEAGEKASAGVVNPF